MRNGQKPCPSKTAKQKEADYRAWALFCNTNTAHSLCYGLGDLCSRISEMVPPNLCEAAALAQKAALLMGQVQYVLSLMLQIAHEAIEDKAVADLFPKVENVRDDRPDWMKVL